ncbi:hypothetical protein BJX96DRAFT_162332 [Aspergillus floccosus]
MQLRAPPTGAVKGCPGILHEYTEDLTAFEYTRGTHSKPHTLIFIGGLGDGLGTVKYLNDLEVTLQGTKWSIFAPVLSSSYNGWGMGSLGQDIAEIAACAHYVREYKEPLYGVGKVVLMGHSTGSQDIMQYLSSANPQPLDAPPGRDSKVKFRNRAYPASFTRPPVDGAIIQAPVSDREAILWEIQTGTERDSPEAMKAMYEVAVANAQRNTYEEQNSDRGCPPIRRDTLVPLSVTGRIGYPANTAVSSRRFLSLVSPESPLGPAEDDMFSSDLGDDKLKQTFGAVRAQSLLRENAQLMVLYSGRDQSVPPWVDKEGLLQRWRAALGEDLWYPGSMVIPGASHSLSDDDQEEPKRILCERTLIFLHDIEMRVPSVLRFSLAI